MAAAATLSPYDQVSTNIGTGHVPRSQALLTFPTHRQSAHYLPRSSSDLTRATLTPKYSLLSRPTQPLTRSLSEAVL